MSYDEARAALDGWRAAYPTDPFASDEQLRSILDRALKGKRRRALRKSASAFARAMVAQVGPLAARYEQRSHLPELDRYDGVGHRREAVSFDPAYHEAGAVVWASGAVALSGVPGRAYEQATLLYLLSLEGEAGHACPATCTIGLARALRRRGDVALRERFLAPLVDAHYGRAQRGAQFLTEVQGGSDVGANACVAVGDADGSFRITGEKWFCSVADADQFFVTARVGDATGTAGLGSFVVPRLIEGEPNGFTLRRLKDKLGTRGLASGEIDFADARGWPIGPVDEGFKTAVSVVLNTSRWMTAVGSTGIMRRAVLEARAYARTRRAFGVTIENFADVRRTVADMAAQWAGALHLVFALTAMEDRIDDESASEHDRLYHRFLVNATKFVVSRQATSVARAGIEVLGGNGTIEEFSVLPRLYRDAIVYESWEGTHNVLVAQVLHDLRRLAILEVVEARLLTTLEGSSDVALADALRERLVTTLATVRHCRDDEEFGAWHFRDALERLGILAEAVYLAGAGESSAATHLLFTYATPGYEATGDAGLVARVAALVGS